MSAFDRDFFFELSKLDQSQLAAVNYDGYRPDVNELHSCGMVSDRFKRLTAGICGDIYKVRGWYKLHEYFRGEPRHIYTYQETRSFRKQLNIAFSIEGLPDDYDGSETAFEEITDGHLTARIGLGFRINSGIKNEGAIDYFEWEQVVREHQAEFDEFFVSLGRYGEPAEFFQPLTAGRVLANRPDYTDDWRFFGRQLNLANDAELLGDYQAFIAEAVRIFTLIDSSIFR